MKSIIVVLIAVAVLVAALAAACSTSTKEDEQAEVTSPPMSTSTDSTTTNDDEQAEVTSPPVPTSTDSTTIAFLLPSIYLGEDSIEERIVNADIIVKARLNRITTEIVTTTAEKWSGKYFVALKFHLTVSDYLNGTGANEITALWVALDQFDTRQEAVDAAPGVVASRDTTWDAREAIFFLEEEYRGDIFSASVQGVNDYYMLDMSLHSRVRKLWLPDAGTTGTGASQEFLLAVPEPDSVTPTITMGELKQRISAINDELNIGDGSDAYKECLSNKYANERVKGVRMSQPNYTGPSYDPRWDGSFASGQPAGSELYEYIHGHVVTDGGTGTETKSEFWIDGEDAALFSITEGDRRPDFDENVMFFSYSVISVRPVPAGTYEFNYHYIPYGYLVCEHTSSFEITADVVAPEGVLHELFFDPVAVNSTVAADSANGVLKPATFLDANGASATIERIAWESSSTDSGQAGTVTIGLTPVHAIAGQSVDFIELDGTVSLSLDIADAAVDTSSDILSWTDMSQPWEDGDLLMVRVREATPVTSPPISTSIDTPSLGSIAPPVYSGEDPIKEPVVIAEQAEVTSTSTSTSTDSTTIAFSPPSIYLGEDSIEERIVNADIIVKARLDRITTEIVTSTTEGWSGEYYVALKFHLTVSQYLNGTGANEITALWVYLAPFDTRQEAEDAAPGVVASRDTTWDALEAIFFLEEEDHRGDLFSASVQGANDYYMLDISIDTYLETVGISLHNRSSELWLPDAGTAGTGDGQEFLLAAPEPDIVTPTITIGELKQRIAAINAELDAGDGSDAYLNCISNKYTSERIERVRATQPGYTGPSYEPYWSGDFASGQPAGFVLYEYDYGFVETEDGTKKKTRFWIDGGDASLFSVTEGDLRPGFEENQNRFSYFVVSTRPIPAKTLEFKHHYGGYIDCGNTATFEMTANVVAPEAVVHEAFFDPVTVGSTVAADSANGVLSPATFADTNGSTATISSIAWKASSTGSGQAGTVTIGLTPVHAIAGQSVDFIELDGTVSLSLDVADAEVDTSSDILSWTDMSQPWEDGDLLMVRILGEPPTCSGGTVVPNPADSPELVKECEALILVKETLAGTAELNWSLDVPITGWDGITVSGTPLRITSLALPSRGLYRRIPDQLGILRHLSNLDLSDNQLTGPIPSELGSLGRITRLRLAGNSFTWCVPVTFRDVKDSDHNDIDLYECMEYGQGRPASEGSAIFTR